MKLEKVRIKNFRRYTELTEITMEQLTAIIGKNDVGKSTILDALDTFFNKTKLDIDDRNVYCENEDVEISCVFSDYPTSIILDESVSTTLASEYLLTNDNKLEICKKYSPSGKETVYIVANHPTNEPYQNLLEKKNTELKRLITDAHIEGVDVHKNSDMRKALWQSLGAAINLDTKEICVNGSEVKEIWSKISPYLPVYYVFRSDRPSTDEEDIAQNPMKLAMNAAILRRQEELNRIAEEIKEEVSAVATKTIEKLSDFDAHLASTLQSTFKKEPTWDKAFSFSLTGDDDIPLNKRGSGVRRLILLSLFRVQCEENLTDDKDIIYAIEEPETSQHPDFQQIIIKTFNKMIENEHCQIIFTTHVPGIAKLLPVQSLRYVVTETDNKVKVKHCTSNTDKELLVEIAKELGVLPDIVEQTAVRNIRLIVCVEGKNDVNFLCNISEALHEEIPAIEPLAARADIIMIPLGGSSLQEWTNQDYLNKLGIPEYHIYDSDCDFKHQDDCDRVNRRGNGCSARMTSKREMENYLHPLAIESFYHHEFVFDDKTDIPTLISNYLKSNNLGYFKETVVKKHLNKEVARAMTLKMLRERDPKNEVLSWICDMENLELNDVMINLTSK